MHAIAGHLGFFSTLPEKMAAVAMATIIGLTIFGILMTWLFSTFSRTSRTIPSLRRFRPRSRAA